MFSFLGRRKSNHRSSRRTANSRGLRLEPFKQRAPRSVIAMVVTLLTAGSVFGQGISFQTVALTGDHPPGIDPGVVYDSVGSPVLNAAGQTAFHVGLSFVQAPITIENARFESILTASRVKNKDYL